MKRLRDLLLEHKLDIDSDSCYIFSSASTLTITHRRFYYTEYENNSGTHFIFRLFDEKKSKKIIFIEDDDGIRRDERKKMNVVINERTYKVTEQAYKEVKKIIEEDSC